MDAPNSLTNEELRSIAEHQKEKRKKYYEENRRVPSAKTNKQKCICCGKEIVLVDIFEYDCQSDEAMYEGTVDIVVPGFGSNFDMVELLIGICDNCIAEAKNDGRISWSFNLI